MTSIVTVQKRIGTAMAALILGSGLSPATAATFAPEVTLPGGPTVRAVEVTTPFAAGTNNFASPKVVDGALHFVDQGGRVFRETSGGFQTVLNLGGSAPAGFDPAARATILDIAEGPSDNVFVATMSNTLPTDAPNAAPIPVGGDYSSTLSYQVIYRYERATDGSLVNPTALASFETGANGHLGGGLLGLEDGNVLFAPGDGLPFGTDGRAAPQDDASHLSKILHIDGTTGATDVVAKGVRNAQRMTWTDGSKTNVAFADIGGVVAEEVNVVPLADLLDDTVVENFGWGRNVDGLAREGTFYIEPGVAFTSGTPAPAGNAPRGEAGFLQPYAQFGREDLAFAAVSGPVFAPDVFTDIVALFGDLVSGRLFATVDDPFSVPGPVDVFQVNLQDSTGAATTLLDLTGGDPRADPRFFNFADGGAGVLLEGAARAFRLTEVSAAVPIPAMGWAFALLLAGMATRRRPAARL